MDSSSLSRRGMGTYPGDAERGRNLPVSISLVQHGGFSLQEGWRPPVLH